MIETSWYFLAPPSLYGSLSSPNSLRQRWRKSEISLSRTFRDEGHFLRSPVTVVASEEQNRLNIKKSRVAENRNYNIRHPWCHHPRSRSKPHSSTPLTSAVTVNICIFLHYKVNSSVYVYFFCFITAWKLRFHAKLDDKITKFRWTRSNVNSEWNIKIFARNDDIAKYNWWSDEHIHVHVLKREHPQIWKQWNEQTIATVRRERGRYFWSLTGTGACARALASLPFSYRIQSDKNIRKRKQGSSSFASSALSF